MSIIIVQSAAIVVGTVIIAKAAKEFIDNYFQDSDHYYLKNYAGTFVGSGIVMLGAIACENNYNRTENTPQQQYTNTVPLDIDVVQQHATAVLHVIAIAQRSGQLAHHQNINQIQQSASAVYQFATLYRVNPSQYATILNQNIIMLYQYGSEIQNIAQQLQDLSTLDTHTELLGANTLPSHL